MIEVTMFVKEIRKFGKNYGGRKFGVATLIYDQGKFGAGVSVLHPEDKFDKEKGKDLSKSRALENLDKNPVFHLKDVEGALFNDLVSHSIGLDKDKGAAFIGRFMDVKDEMVFRMAMELNHRDAGGSN